MLEGSFVADDKFPDVVAALEARGWRRQHAHFPRPQLRWANYARVPWARVAATQIVSHLQHAVVFSQKAELARRLRAYQRRLQQHGGKTDVVDAFYPRTVELGGERAWRELARWAAYSRALTAVGRYARSLQEGEDTAPPGLGMLRCSITFLEAALRDESFFLQGDEECQVDADAEEWSMLTASRTGGAAAASTDELFPLTTIENAGVMDLLQRVRARDPQFLAVRDDGEGEGEGDSVWICKPSNLSQGRGITLIRNLSELTDLLNTPSSEKANTQQQWIVQKYIERPLLLQGGRKFDIRQWVLITALSPDARVYWYRDCYLRFCAQPFSLNAESCRDRYAHLTNYSVQKDFVSGVTSHREVACEDGGSPGITSAFESMWCSNQASDVLRQQYGRNVWDGEIVPKMQNVTKHVLSAVLPELRAVGRGFEWLGFDFLLDESLAVWLLEVNVSPDVSHSTPVTAQLVPCATTDALALILDPPEEIGSDNRWIPLELSKDN